MPFEVSLVFLLLAKVANKLSFLLQVFILFSGTLSLLLEVTLLSLLKGTLHSVSRQPKSASLLVRICNNSGY